MLVHVIAEKVTCHHSALASDVRLHKRSEDNSRRRHSEETKMSCTTVHEKRETAFRPLRMNWVVVTAANGDRRPQMSWRTNRAD